MALQNTESLLSESAGAGKYDKIIEHLEEKGFGGDVKAVQSITCWLANPDLLIAHKNGLLDAGIVNALGVAQARFSSTRIGAGAAFENLHIGTK